jgi:hypothetical protein
MGTFCPPRSQVSSECGTIDAVSLGKQLELDPQAAHTRFITSLLLPAALTNFNVEHALQIALPHARQWCCRFSIPNSTVHDSHLVLFDHMMPYFSSLAWAFLPNILELMQRRRLLKGEARGSELKSADSTSRKLWGHS